LLIVILSSSRSGIALILRQLISIFAADGYKNGMLITNPESADLLKQAREL
jgi:hypothetical protein